MSPRTGKGGAYRPLEDGLRHVVSTVSWLQLPWTQEILQRRSSLMACDTVLDSANLLQKAVWGKARPFAGVCCYPRATRCWADV